MTNPGMQARWGQLWVGIDPATKAFVEQVHLAGEISDEYKGDVRDWLQACRDAGVSTSLDADFTDPRMAKLLDERLSLGCYPSLRKKRVRHIEHVKHALKIYFLAAQPQHGLRTRSVPPVAVPIPSRWSLSRADARALLPEADQRKLEAIDRLIRASAKKQWMGMGAKMISTNGRRHKATVSVGGSVKLSEVVDYFLRFAALQNPKWNPFTLKALLTPERVVQFLYYAHRYDGGALSLWTVRNRERLLLDYFHRGRVARPTPVVVITEQQDEAIRRALASEQQYQDQWNLSAPSLSNTGADKWYPDVSQVELAISALEADIVRADDAHERGFSTDKQHWRAVRNATMTLCALYCMWRVDTIATISLAHLRRDPVTGSVVDENGFAVVENIARAKGSSGRWYPFVPELTLPPNVVRLIENLLKIEGRSMAKPLKDGWDPVRLSAAAGDRWGNDPVMDGELVVVPLFRTLPDRAEGLSYGAIQCALEEQLELLHFGATNPHTLRATGAIYWRFIQEMPEDLVMALGLWEDPKVLNSCYAHIGQRDRRARMVRYIPMTSGVVPVKPRGRREQSAAASLTVLGKLLEKSTNAHEARRYLAELHRHYQEIDQTIASELGVTWEPIRPDRFEPGETDRIETALVSAGWEGGISAVIGRDFSATDVLRARAAALAAGPTAPKKLRRFRTLVDLRSAQLALAARAPLPTSAPAAPAALPAPRPMKRRLA